jgi:hypothetical protein
MICNVGWVEQIVRVLLGLPTVAAYFYTRHFSPHWSLVLLAIGITLLATALARRCPMHYALGTSTVRKRAPMVGTLETPDTPI